MRTDITNNPLMREFILKPKNAIYNGSPDRPVLVYHFEEHDNLRGMMQVLENHGLIRDITFNDVKRYVMEERLVSYLTQ
jgi:hypothetical protein